MAKKPVEDTSGTKNKNKEAISNINRTGTVSGKSSGVSNISGNIPKDTTNTSNLAGTNNIKNAAGTSKVTTPSSSTGINTQSYNLAGTNNISNAVGTPSTTRETGKSFVPVDNTTAPKSKGIAGLFTSEVNKQNPVRKIKEQEKTYSYKDNYTTEDRDFLGNRLDTLLADPLSNEDVMYRDMWSEDKKKAFDANQEEINKTAKEYKVAQTQVALKKMKDDANKEGDLEEGKDVVFDNNGKYELIDYKSQLENSQADKDRLQKELDALYEEKAKYGQGIENAPAIATLNYKIANIERQLRERVAEINDISRRQNYQNAVLGEWSLNEAKKNSDSEALDELYKAYESYDDTFIERRLENVAKIGIDMASTITSTVDILRDLGGEALADTLEKDAQKLLETGEITDEEFNNIITRAKMYADFDATDEDNLSTLLRNASNQIAYEIQNGEDGVGAFIGQGLDSTANFLAQFLLLGEAGSLAMMSGQSGTQKYFENLEKGYSKETALLNGIATGLTSYMTERIGMDNFVSILNGTVGQGIYAQALNAAINGESPLGFWAQSLLSQGLAEGLEEVAEGNADFVLDNLTAAIANGEPVEYNPGDIFYSFLVGAFSGALMGAAGSTYNIAVNTREQYNALKNDVNALAEIRREALAKGEDVSSIDQAIRVGSEALNNFAANSQTMGVTFVGEDVDTTLAPNETDSVLTETLRPNVDQEVNTTLDKETLVENVTRMSQDFLNMKGINMDAREFVDLSTEARENVTAVADYASKLNVNVAFSSDINGDGYFDPETKQVVINPNSKLGEVSTMVHEFTHLNEASAFYQTLADLVSESFDGDMNVALANIKKAYAQHGIKLNNDYAKREFVAINTQQMLGNQEFVDKLVRYNNSLAYRMFKDIQAMFNGDVKTQLENTFMKAFQDVQTEIASKGLPVEFSTSLTPDEIKKISPRAFNEDGTIKSVRQQISEMNKDASSFGMAVVPVGKGLDFANVITDDLFFSKKDLKHIREHISDDNDIARILSDIKDTAVLGMDYVDVNNEDLIKKAIILDRDDGLYRMGLTQNEKRDGIIIEELTTLLRDDEFLKYFNEALNAGRTIYTNEKSSDFLSRFSVSLGGVDNGSASTFSKTDFGTIVNVATGVDGEDFKNDASSDIEDDAFINSEEGSAFKQFSLGTWLETDRKKVVDDLVDTLNVSEEKAKKWVKDVNSVAKVIADNKALLDYEANPVYSSMKSNDEYVASMDMSTLCKKREVLQGTIDEIQRRLPNYDIDGAEYTKIRQMLKDKGYEVACGFCYVESRRKELGKVAKSFIDSRNYDNLSIYDLTTVNGVNELQRTRPEIYEDFVKFNNKRGSGKVNLVQSRTEYRGEIMDTSKLTDGDVEKILRIGGLRLQSYSDFETPHLIDTMQIVLDMSRRGLTSQAYTKVTDFADAFGETGIKINESLVCKGVDSKGKLIFDDVEGMPHQKAFELRNKHPENVGTVLVGKDDDTIIAAMADPRIDYIIPFHRSGWGKAEYAALGIEGYKDYTKVQKEYWVTPREYVNANGNTVKENAPVDQFYPIDYWDYSKSGKENAEAYLRLCAEDGRIPKFSNFLVDNGDGTWSLQPDGSTDGYWKMLIDFKMYDNNGVGVPQQPVQPIFDNRVNQRILRNYGGEHTKNRFSQEVVNEFVNGINNGRVFSEGLTPEEISKPITPQEAEDNVLSISEDQINIKSVTKNMEKGLEQNAVAQILRDNPKPATFREKLARAKEIAAREIVDHQFAIRELARKYKNNLIVQKGDFAMLAPNMAAQTLTNKRYKIGTNQVIGESLYDIIHDLNEDQQYTLSEYLYHFRNIDHLTVAERTNGEYADRKGVFGESVGVKESQNRIAEIEAENEWVKDKAERLWEFCKQNKNMLVEGGIISQETADLLEEINPHYIPIQRNKAGGSGVKATDPNKAVRKYRGSTIDILPLFPNKDNEGTLAKHTNNVYRSILNNSFHNEIMDTVGGLSEMDPDAVEEILDEGFDPLGISGETGAKYMYAYRDGKKYSMAVDEDIYEALSPTKNPWGLPNLKPVESLSGWRRNLITGWNPLFAFTNGIKDIQDALFNTKNPLKFLPNYIEAWAQIATNGDFKQTYLANGGAQNTYIGEMGSPKVKGSSIIAKAWNALINVNEAVEMAPRLAEFMMSLKEGKVIEEAMYDAAEVTTNFKRGGDTAKYLNRNGFAFLNASIQGFDKQVRNLRDAKDGGVKGMLTYMVKATVMGGLPLYILNHLMWKDDKDYEELSDYVKDNYYCVKKYGDGKFIRIPKGRMMAFLQTVVQNTSDTIQGKVKLWDALIDDYVSLMDNVAPNNPVENFILTPLIQAANNKTWYGEDLVPSRLQDVPDSEQYDESTDLLSKKIGELSKKVSDATGMDFLEMSPYKINYVLDQYSGVIGDIGLPMMTQETSVAVDNPALKGAVTPFLDKFTTDSVLKNQNVTDLYALRDETNKLANSAYATDEQVLANKYIYSVTSEMGKLYAEMHSIQADPTLSNKEKYNQTREIKKQINDLAREGLANYDQINISGDYASVGGVQYYKTEDGWKKPSKSQLEKVSGLSDEDRDAYFQTFGEITNTRDKIKADTPDGEKADYTKATIDAISNSKLSAAGKNTLFDSYYDSKFTGYVNDMDLTDEQKYTLKVANKLAQGEKDENGKTIANSKARATAEAYREAGLLDYVLKYIDDNNLSPSDLGLSKKVYNELTGGGKTSYQKAYSNTMSSKKVSIGSAPKTKVSTGYSAKSGKAAKISAAPQSKTNNTKDVAKSYLKAYAQTMKKQSVSSGGSSQTCPNCGARVPANASRCPNCGKAL